ncbi:hypothetical protein C824_003750 [Schaedlerella arabinosiphila]|nr:hypothetical protein C824_003750 [Schaedlerella arabinosiphila]
MRFGTVLQTEHLKSGAKRTAYFNQLNQLFDQIKSLQLCGCNFGKGE